MIEITDEMVSRFMTGGLRGYDIRVDKYVDFTRPSARSFLEMVLNPRESVRVPIPDPLARIVIPTTGQLHAHGRNEDKIQGEWVSNWHRRSGDPI